jgi:hypothetical protein
MSMRSHIKRFPKTLLQGDDGMFGKLAKGAAAIALAAAVGAPALAHHSVAMFDFEKEVTLQGTIVEFQYTNPHSWLIIAVKNDDGTTTNWGFEAEGPSTLQRRGIGRNSLPVGMEVTVRGRPMKDGRPAAAWIDVTLPDGTVLDP